MFFLQTFLNQGAGRLRVRCGRQAIESHRTRPYQHLYTQSRRLHLDSFLQGNSADYMDDMYAEWQKDTASVDVSWKRYFEAIEAGKQPPEYLLQAPQYVPFQWGPWSSPMLPGMNIATKAPRIPSTAGDCDDQARIQRLVRAFQDFGHQLAKTNPLDLPGKDPSPELRLEFYGFTENDLDREFALGPQVLPSLKSTNRQYMTLRDILKTCESIYCGSIGAEYSHVATHEERDWIRERIESPEPYQFPAEEKKRILDRLVWSTNFEKFLAAKFPNAKRFGLEGVESQLPAVKAVIDASAENGVRNIIFPCCHRGKLNVLSNLTRKPNELIFNEFLGELKSRHGIPGDVKYHLGMNYERETPLGKKVNISILPNPSHLEAQNPVAQGMARAVQQQNEEDRASTMVFNSHTDAAFSGQGVIYETLGLSGLKSYETGGTIHLVVNNQVGFTTDPESARTSSNVSDIVKSIGAPVFHVNADDVEAVVFVCKLAADYRAKFAKDCLIDMLCYRKNGHNEMDQPSFTQPLMYQQIANKVTQLELYIAKLVQEGMVTREEVTQMEAEVWTKLSESLANSQSPQSLEREYLTTQWQDMKRPDEVSQEVFPAKSTSITQDVVDTVASKMGVPEQPFTVHKSLRKILQKRQQSLMDGREIDWATAEALAVGSLCLEGHHVRISGQDVERGTFSQRHAVLHDQNSGSKFTPLNSLSPTQARLTVGNSSLSEYGVMGFDYGYSCMHPNALVMWEAQFGDFANNAQCIIDQFISSAESKWLLRSGIVLSLPHGFDGQGSEHSSARMERFLQLCNEDARFFPSPGKLDRQHQDANMQVVYMTTPANMFHVLRRQLHREFRKPLIMFFSKSLLRHPMARSNIGDFIGASKFQPLIPDPAHGTSISNPSGIKRVIYCTGQVYQNRETHAITNTAITRIEQLHPFPWQQVRDNLDQYPSASDVVWCQEESLNDGPWAFTRSRLETIFDTTVQHKGRRLRFAGREATASVATGFVKEHHAQEAALLRDTFRSV
ncbi:DehydrogenaseE1 component [Penicillium desertorum]|uniref:2-oxoglutarate dehydrogenase, mitochondrial n=1 Tax=Penicillium desertorum TaxID=1303715 RepID=A0A9W9X0B4_9EURO|nr:DehydrogenaseE1 component [Penicillium desertorum]